MGAAVEAAPLGVTEAASGSLSFVRAEWWRLLLTSHPTVRSGPAQDLCFGVHQWVLDTNMMACAPCVGVSQLWLIDWCPCKHPAAMGTGQPEHEQLLAEASVWNGSFTGGFHLPNSSWGNCTHNLTLGKIRSVQQGLEMKLGQWGGWWRRKCLEGKQSHKISKAGGFLSICIFSLTWRGNRHLLCSGFCGEVELVQWVCKCVPMEEVNAPVLIGQSLVFPQKDFWLIGAAAFWSLPVVWGIIRIMDPQIASQFQLRAIAPALLCSISSCGLGKFW